MQRFNFVVEEFVDWTVEGSTHSMWKDESFLNDPRQSVL